MNKDVRKGLLRHKFVYHFLRILIGWFFIITQNFSYKYYRIKEKPVLILSNHNSDFDPFLMIIGLRKHFKFVASANIMSGPVGKLIDFLVGPIPRAKGADADDTVQLIIENLNVGIDVAMFPEGNKSWDGLTNFISKRTAEIFKKAKCGLVTYRFDGGYLRSPRWARFSRKGKVFGQVVNEYSYEQLKDMSTDEIYDIITSDLNVDAYQYQDTNHIRYSGDALAEGLENLTYLCPICKRFDTIHTKGNKIWCDCGMKATFDEYGYINGEKLADYNNTVKWNRFQKKWLASHKDEFKKNRLTSFSRDNNLRFYKVANNERILLADDITSQIFGDRLILTNGNDYKISFAWKDITKMGMFRNNRLYFTHGGDRYQLERPSGFSLIKYFALWRTLTDKEFV